MNRDEYGVAVLVQHLLVALDNLQDMRDGSMDKFSEDPEEVVWRRVYQVDLGPVVQQFTSGWLPYFDIIVDATGC